MKTGPDKFLKPPCVTECERKGKWGCQHHENVVKLLRELHVGICREDSWKRGPLASHSTCSLGESSKGYQISNGANHQDKIWSLSTHCTETQSYPITAKHSLSFKPWLSWNTICNSLKQMEPVQMAIFSVDPSSSLNPYLGWKNPNFWGQTNLMPSKAQSPKPCN